MNSKYFDGYNNLVHHERDGMFALVEYVRDEWYGGTGEIHVVRLGTHGEDVISFVDSETALRCYLVFHETYESFKDAMSRGEILDECLRRWRRNR